MSKAKQVLAMEAEVSALHARILSLKAKARAVGYFLECSQLDSNDHDCGRKVFVASGQNPPANWLTYVDSGVGVMYICSDCAREHADVMVQERGYKRLGKTRSQRRRERQSR